MNKVIVRQTDSNDEGGYVIIADADGNIIHEEYLFFEEMDMTTLVNAFALAKQYAPFTLHFITEDDVNTYLALAPISEYPAAQDEDEDDGYDDEYDHYYDDEDDEDYEDDEDEDEYVRHFYQPIADDFDGDICSNCNDRGCACNTYVPPTTDSSPSMAMLFDGLVDSEPSTIEDASRD